MNSNLYYKDDLIEILKLNNIIVDPIITKKEINYKYHKYFTIDSLNGLNLNKNITKLKCIINIK